MNEQSREGLDAYYRESASWNHDRLEAMRVSQRRAWWIAGAAVAVALLQGAALMLLTPLKTVEPYTLLVDRTTGYVQALKPLETARIAPDSALTQSFLVQYVIARESFDMAIVQPNYRKVALLSTGSARKSYIAAMQVNSPTSPLIVYPRGTIVETRVKSVSPVGPDSAMVRFDTLRSAPNGVPQLAGSFVALVRYRYSKEPMKLEDRFVNPLGFQVTSYRRDPEALPQPIPVAAVAVPSPPTSLTPAALGAAAPGHATGSQAPGQPLP